MKDYQCFGLHERDSNMELLRIIAMILVMIVHADFRALPVPTVLESNVEPASSFLRFLTESFSITCVNVFILLSGWYGIKLKLNRLLEFLFQIAFFSLLGFSIFYFLSPIRSVTLRDCASIFLFRDDYWFVKAYLGLYLLSPILNAFVESATKKQFKILLYSFFAFQTLYGWLSSGAVYIMAGYSAFSFIGLYLLARYIRLYSTKLIEQSRWWNITVYFFIAVSSATVAFFLRKYDISGWGKFYMYTSPLVIVAAVCLLLFFVKVSIKSRWINWIASSSFAIYLLHSNSFLAGPYYDEIILNWFNDLNRPMFLLNTTVFIILIFVIAILVDKVRIILWKVIKLI